MQSPPPHLVPHPLMKELLLPTLCHYQTISAALPSLFNYLLYFFALQSIYLSLKDDGIVRICPPQHLFAYSESHH